MNDILLGVIRLVTTLALGVAFAVLTRNRELHRLPGWRLLVSGIALIAFGAAIGLTGNFPDLSRYVVIGDTATRNFIEHVIGNFGGFLLVLIGLLKWLPEFVSLKGSDAAWARGMSSTPEAGSRLQQLALKQKRALEVLRTNREQLTGALHIAHLGSWGWDMTTDALRWSDEAYRIFGLQPKSFTPTRENILHFVHPEDRTQVRQVFDKARRERRPYSVDYRIVRPDGNLRYLHEQAETASDSSGQAVGLVGIVQDVTEHKLTEQVMQRNTRNLRVLADSTVDGVLVGVKGRVVFANRRAAEMAGSSVPELANKTIGELIGTDEHVGSRDRIERIAHGEDVQGMHEAVFVRRDGSRIPVEVSAANTLWYDRPATVITVRDVTLRKQAEVDLLQEQDRIHGAMASIGEAVVTTDVNGFVDYMNPVAERLTGWSAAEARGQPLSNVFNVVNGATLEALESPVVQCLREGRPCRPEGAVVLHPRRGKEFTINSFAAPIRDRHGGTIGVVVTFQTSSRTPLPSPAAAVRQAAEASATGASRDESPPPAVQAKEEVTEAHREDEQEGALRITQALEDKRLLLYQQQIQPLSPRMECAGFVEFLIRMLDEQGRLVAPAAFLPAAEHNNLMPDIDRWVIHSTFQLLRSDGSLPEGERALAAVSIAGQSLRDPRFLDFVIEQLDSAGIDPRTLCFQIAEPAIVSDLSSTMRFAAAMRDRGCRFAVDDFGSGRGSYAYLRVFRTDYIKIPAGFVRNMLNDVFDAAMVESLNQIGHIMGLQTIAKGVEDAKALERLRRLGVDCAQGAGIAKPAPTERGKLWTRGA